MTCQWYVSQPKGELSVQLRNELKIVGVWVVGEIGLCIDKVIDELQADLDRCRARLHGGAEQAELLPVLMFVVRRHVFEHAVEYDRKFTGHVSEGGGRCHATAGQALVHIAK